MKKLQANIDRLLKKVNEGVETTENIFDKIQNLSSSNQKDRFETDLKKEIKKLQRLRDQIKTYLASNDVKDKRALTDHRRLIESQMERFKQVEKEMKTKAYSKEGLLQMERVDPKEKEKTDASEFVTNAVDELSRQIEVVQFEIEQLQGANPKRGNRKSDRQHAECIQQKEATNERRNYHINRLELILRLLENNQLEPDQISNLKDPIQYYVECNQEPDFKEDENLYDNLNLEKEEELYNIRTVDFHGKSDSENDIEHEEKNNMSEVSRGLFVRGGTFSNMTSPVIEFEEEFIPKPVEGAIDKDPISPIQMFVEHRALSDSEELAHPPPVVNAWVEPPKIVKASSSAAPKKPAEVSLPSSLADLGQSYKLLKTMHKNDASYQQRILDVSLQHIPDLIDSERPKIYQPRNPLNLLNFYPEQPLAIFTNPILFEKFDMDTLFYIFYFQQGTYQQYLAAKELKKQSWRFHKKYSTWFQRYEEPKEITDEYEQGTYVYFDYEGAWCQRMKTDFKFEYRFLEDS